MKYITKGQLWLIDTRKNNYWSSIQLQDQGPSTVILHNLKVVYPSICFQWTKVCTTVITILFLLLCINRINLAPVHLWSARFSVFIRLVDIQLIFYHRVRDFFRRNYCIFWCDFVFVFFALLNGHDLKWYYFLMKIADKIISLNIKIISAFT